VAFEKSTAYAWLNNNAYQYGFILSYPKDNVYYQYEPWHWRFIGVELATKLHNENRKFSDMDQREIDTYLIKIFN
jgi:LAS superfamily LD-carboxypeptidase LdcB